MGVSLRDAMMSLKHPSNPRFSLVHSIDKHWKDDCYLITCLKSADLLTHTMIAALLPYLKWTLEAKHGKIATAQVPKWFKPAARMRSMEAFWDLKEECVCNKSDEMLTATLSDADGLYWEADVQEQATPKRKKIKVDEESVSDSISTVKTAISSVRTRGHTSTTQTNTKEEDSNKIQTDAKTVDSQMSTITQLTKQVSILQLAHNEINSKLNKLTEFIMAQVAKPTSPQSKQKAAGGLRGSPSQET